MCVYSQIFKMLSHYHWFIPTVTHFLILKLIHYTHYWLLWIFSLTMGLFHSSTWILLFYGRCDMIVTPVALLPTLPSHLYYYQYMYDCHAWCTTDVYMYYDIIFLWQYFSLKIKSPWTKISHCTPRILVSVRYFVAASGKRGLVLEKPRLL